MNTLLLDDDDEDIAAGLGPGTTQVIDDDDPLDADDDAPEGELALK
jgi:hypothetical protein